MKSDIEIARESSLKKIKDVAAEIGIGEDELFQYGNYMAKIERKNNDIKNKKLILVTAINPTPAGEGKTTVSIGLADALKLQGKKTALALREPSLGPVFGIKGGAAGGGYAQIAPMDDINLNFTGDIHAITAANNLLSAMVDNHIFWGNELRIKNVTWRRCLDVNDRALRNVITGLGYNTAKETGFDITAASEIMAILCLSRDENDLKERLGNIIIGQDENGKNIKASDFSANDAMAVILKDAIKPNLVQTLEGTPAFVHGGPFANIAHGCNSIIATKTALSYADYVVTEAGFGADLGAEKFFDIKCRTAGLNPSCVVLVATIRAMKYSGGKAKSELNERDDNALLSGFSNVKKHIENITKVFNMPCVVAINRFFTDTDEEVNTVISECKKCGADAVVTDCFALGGKGGTELAKRVIALAEKPTALKFSYDTSDTIKGKIEKIATKIYGADGVIFEKKAADVIASLEGTDAERYPVCIAKTQYSLSDDPKRLGRPEGFKLTVKDVILKNGAGFITIISGSILLMPGLGKVPNAEKIKINDGIIDGLF